MVKRCRILILFSFGYLLINCYARKFSRLLRRACVPYEFIITQFLLCVKELSAFAQSDKFTASDAFKIMKIGICKKTVQRMK